MPCKIKNLILALSMTLSPILQAEESSKGSSEQQELHLSDIRQTSSFVKEEMISLELSDFDCHSSSIIEVSPGVLCAVWKGGPGKGTCNFDIKENVGIWISHFQDGKWSKPKELIIVPHSVSWAPVLCKLPSGEMLLFCRIGKDPRNVITVLKRSYDGGFSWSAAEVLPAGFLGPTKSKPIVLVDGTLICGSSMQNGEPQDEFKATNCWIEITPDGGRSWKKYGPIELPEKRFGALSPALFRDKEGFLHMLCRDRSFAIGETGWIWQAVSEDGGKSWSSFEKTSLPNPDSGIDTLDLGEGKVLLVYNHSHTKRYPLTLAMTTDGGKSWKPLYTLEERSGEFPFVVQTSDGLVHITYAYKAEHQDQRRIKHMVLDPSTL